MDGRSNQRAWKSQASELSAEASEALRPLHDDLAEISPSYDGIVYFAVDQWHANNASAVATVQPESDDTNRFLFYKEKIAKHRVDLAATALGLSLQMESPILLKSRMNPDAHLTWAHRTIIDDSIAGGLQAAFNTQYGPTPSETDTLEKAWKKHETTINDVAASFRTFSQNTDSIGDTLELLAPATPNAYIVSWDLHNSTRLAETQYGALRDYLIDAKSLFRHGVNDLKTHFHDTGDGQDITFWLPDGVDRSSTASVRHFGEEVVLPRLVQLRLQQLAFAVTTYSDIRPQLNYAVGLGYVEQDRHDERTSQEYWQIAKLHKTADVDTVAFTKNADQIFKK